MGGGLIQLSAIGKENSYLTSNPQISFFKAVYKRYANFSMQSIKTDLDTQDTLDFNNSTKMKIKLKKNGDLLHKMYLDIKLPNIFSSINRDNVISANDLEFRWVDNLGFAMIKNVRISIGGEIIEEYDGEYLYLYEKNYNSKEKNNIISAITNGNIPDRDIENSYNLYSKSTTYLKDGVNYLDKGFNNCPSLKSELLRVPLPFWFHRNIGCALPICALEYHDVNFEIEFRPIKELFTLSNKTLINLKTDPISSVSHTQFITSTELGKTKDEIMEYFENKRWILEPSVDITYIYLEKDLRMSFMSKHLQYLVEPINKETLSNKSGSINYTTQFYHPVKELYIIPRRNDVSKRNMWLNFSNLDDDSETNYYNFQNFFYKIAKSESNSTNSAFYYIGQFVTNTDRDDLQLDSSEWTTALVSSNFNLRGIDCYLPEDIENFLKIWKYRDFRNIPYIGPDNCRFFSSDIITNLTINFDQLERVSKHDYNYYNKVQPFLSNISSNLEGPLLYSFSLDGLRLQPSGKCNFSHIKNVTFNIDLKEPLNNDDVNMDYKYDLTFYTRYYNILNINSGVADLAIRN